MTDDRDIEALVCAAREGRLSDVQRMLREVADLKIDDYAGSSHTSAIDAAIQFNRVQVVRWLSQQYSSFGPMMLCKAYRALATDSTSDREAMVRMLHEHRAPQGSCYEPFQDPEVLNEAATSGMDDVVKLLIKRGADINAEEDKTKLTPLIAAMAAAKESVVRILLNAGAAVETRASPEVPDLLKEYTPLIFAACYRLKLSIRLLLERGASVHAVDARGETALMYTAGSLRDSEPIMLLLKAGARIDAQSKSGETALMVAAYMGNDATARVLLKHGASVHLVDNKNQTPLMRVSFDGIDTMRLLLDAGSLVNAQSTTGDTALMAMVKASRNARSQSGKPNTMSLLLKSGASIDQVNNQGWTALMIAAYEGYDHSVSILLQHGASVHIQTSTGDTALSLAQEQDHAKVVSLLSGHAVSAPIRHGHAVSAGYNGEWLRLLQAATIGDHRTVLELLEAHVPIDNQTSAGETALMRAVWNQQVQVVHHLIKCGANLNVLNNKKWSALLIAVHIDNAEITQLLVKAGAAVDTLGNDGESALMRAASKANEEIVRLLLDHGASVDLERQGTRSVLEKKRWTALTFAASGGFANVVKVLIKAGAAVNRDEECDGDFPLTCAAKNGHEEVVQMLIEHGAQLNVINKNEYGYTALQCAALGGHKMVVQAFIKSGANLDYKNSLGFTALKCAADRGHDELVFMLLEGGASIDECDGHGETALMRAAQSGREKCVLALLQSGASVTQADKKGFTPLVYAAWCGFDKCVRLLLQEAPFDTQNGQEAMIRAAEGGREGCINELLQAGVSIDSRSETSDTALISAAWSGKDAVVKFLLAHGASIALKDANNRTALIRASMRGYHRVVGPLIQAHALVNVKGSDGRSALSMAAKCGHGQTVFILLANGACVDSIDNKGRTPLMLAAKNGFIEIICLLLHFKAKIDAADHEGLTSVTQAALNGHAKVVGLLRIRGASFAIRTKNGSTAAMLAADFGDNYVMREMLLARVALLESVAYLQAGMLNYSALENKSIPHTQHDQARASAADLFERCKRMIGASGICLQVCTRLIDIENQIKITGKIAQRRPMKDYSQILEPFQILLIKYARKPTLIHLMSSDQIVETCRRTNKQIDAFMRDHHFKSAFPIHCDWQAQFCKDTAVYRFCIEESIQTDQKALFEELQSPEAQQEALTLLLFECEGKNPESKYSEREIDFMHRIYSYVSSLTKIKIPSPPKWFVPPQHVDVNAEFARGSYGSIHKGTWNGVEVVVKRALPENEQSLGVFLQEVDVWNKLQHPNVVQLFGACHVGKTFFVCELAANGTLSNYLFEKDLETVWEKLLEAARGLLHLHEVHSVVHGDLKCNNILVGGSKSSKNRPAKLTDFGLSFVAPSEANAEPKPSDQYQNAADEVGAIQWKAPEVVAGWTRGSLASDVYSFGMCIAEAIKAVKGECLPWGIFPDVTVKYKVLKLKQLPKRPTEVNDEQWELISRMCAWEPKDRPTMKQVVDALGKLAQDQSP